MGAAGKFVVAVQKSRRRLLFLFVFRNLIKNCNRKVSSRSKHNGTMVWFF